MKDKVCFKSDTSAQILILTGFVIAVIIVGMGTVLYSVANSGQQTSILQSDRAYENFENIREEYGIALMASSEKGEIDPFNVSNTTIILEFEDRMKTIVESHGFILNFTESKYFSVQKHASVNILFTDGKKVFNDTVTYNLLTGKILYDTIPPGHILDLNATTWDEECEYDGAVHLYFTAVGDDGYEEGTSAKKYEICYAESEITNDEDFENASNANQCGYWYVSALNGSLDHAYIYNVEPGYWHFSIKVYDEANNPSNVSQPYDVQAYPSGWSPEIYNITNISGTPITETNPELPVLSGDNVTIKFNVTDKDEDNVSIILMVRNNTDWYEGTNWTNQDHDTYNNESYYYTFSDNISENWDFYINVTDDDAPCFRNTSSPEYAPDNYYSINLTDYTPPKTIMINSTDNVSDAYIDENDLNPHDGTEILINGKKNFNQRGLIWFNLSSIPSGAVIESAKISLNATDIKNANPISIYRVNNSWNENTVIWSDITGFEPIETDSSIPIINMYSNWTVTEDVQYYLTHTNNGWIIRYSDDETNNAPQDAKFHSKTGTYGPILYVTYTE